ncbi:MAG: hypothetical protein JSW23_01440 [Planctomycetota bacterium]|nr:MAG: hypothetical protein JSW23_01440 [Planctomycetota bacterium]
MENHHLKRAVAKFVDGWLAPSVCVGIGTAVTMFSFRVVAIMILIVFFGVGLKKLKHRKNLFAYLCLFVYTLSSLQPFDISFINVPGPPKIVRYGKGYPAPETIEEARRGEVVLGGCVVTGNHPRWLLVW